MREREREREMLRKYAFDVMFAIFEISVRKVITRLD